MKTVTYKSILDRVATYMGESGGLADEEAILANVKVNLYARLGWNAFFWPELMPVEKRRFRVEWDATVTYAPGAEVFLPGAAAYYQALVASAGQPPAAWTPGSGWVENSAYWALSQGDYGTLPSWAPGAVLAVGNKVVNPYDGEMYQCIVSHVAGPTFDVVRFGKLARFRRIIFYDQTEVTPVLSNAVPLWVLFKDQQNGQTFAVRVLNKQLDVDSNVPSGVLALDNVGIDDRSAAGTTWYVSVSGQQLVSGTGTNLVVTDRVPIWDTVTGQLAYLKVDGGQLVVGDS